MLRASMARLSTRRACIGWSAQGMRQVVRHDGTAATGRLSSAISRIQSPGLAWHVVADLAACYL
jgi:hypothetical protein